MRAKAYRALTFLGAALVVVNVVHRWALYEYFDGRGHYAVANAFHSGQGITVSALFTLAFAYLWASSQNSN